MSEETRTDQQEAEQPFENADSGKMFTQEEVSRIVRERLARSRERSREAISTTAEELLSKERAAAELKIKEYADQVEDLLSQVADYKTELARLEVAQECGLSPELASRLNGKTKGDLLADANRMTQAFNAYNRSRTPAPPLMSNDPSDGYSEEYMKKVGLKGLANQLTGNV